LTCFPRETFCRRTAEFSLDACMHSVYPVHVIIEMGMDFVLPISFLLEAISIIIYGICKMKLEAWEIFLSSWYVSVFAILIIYYVWWPIQYTSHSGEKYPTPPSASFFCRIPTFNNSLPVSSPISHLHNNLHKIQETNLTNISCFHRTRTSSKMK
jgi:hypothetical protein